MNFHNLAGKENKKKERRHKTTYYRVALFPLEEDSFQLG